MWRVSGLRDAAIVLAVVFPIARAEFVAVALDLRWPTASGSLAPTALARAFAARGSSQMQFLFALRQASAVLGLLLALMVACTSAGTVASAQTTFAAAGQFISVYPRSKMAEPVAVVPRTCTSISSKSRRCFFTFAKNCKARGASKEHCTRMSGFCHGCTDAYATCKGEQNIAAQKSGASGTDCSQCNIAYDRCISRMVEQYGGALIKVK